MTPRRTEENVGNQRNGTTFDPVAMAELEGRVKNGEKDIEELRALVREREQSQDRLEKRIETDMRERNTLDRQLYERLGSIGTMQKVMVTLVSLVLASLIGLAFVALHR